MSLHVDFRLQRGGFALDVRFDVRDGETVALLGPNGAGKTTALLAIAGLLRIDDGRIALAEHVLDGGPAVPFVPAEARRAGFVFQDHVLFPHLNVVENVAFGLRSRGEPKRPSLEAASRWLERVGISQAHHRSLPNQLSGGQAQRVALARALASSPRLLLLDEPLASVDASAKLDLRRELRDHLATFAGPRLLVVHDIADALSMAERIVVIEHGRVVQDGPIRELVHRPRTRYVADLVGLNCFHGVCRESVVRVGGAAFTVASPLEGEVVVTVHPRAVALYRERPTGSPRNVWQAPVVAIEPTLDRIRVQLGGELPIVAEVTAAAVHDLELCAGRQVWASVKATEAEVYLR
ncbi:MAG: sulfate/molybdate ABC transporter ATP-binding protein [Planctomycetota bacterium]